MYDYGWYCGTLLREFATGLTERPSMDGTRLGKWPQCCFSDVSHFTNR